MKKISLLVFLFFSIQYCHAQISCSDFCVKEVLIDSSNNPNTLRFIIAFNGSSSSFINYPYISLLSNSNGDSLGSGTLFIFGQFGGTTETYDVSTSLDSIPTDFMLHFSFDTVVCTFNNLCPTTTAIQDLSAEEFYQIYPNPVQNLAIIECKKEIQAFKKLHILNYNTNPTPLHRYSFQDYLLHHNNYLSG